MVFVFGPLKILNLCHDLSPERAIDAGCNAWDQSGIPSERPWPHAAWPSVPTRFLLRQDDRFFPADFQHPMAQERLGTVPHEMDGGHQPAIGRPHELVQRLEAYLPELVPYQPTFAPFGAVAS